VTWPPLLTAMMATGAPVRLRTEPAAGRKPTTRSPFLVVLSLGPAWTRKVPSDHHPALVARGEYLDHLFHAGALLVAGPLLDDSGIVSLEAVTGAVLVVRAATRQGARRLAEEDPAIRAGLLRVAEVRGWGPSLAHCE